MYARPPAFGNGVRSGGRPGQPFVVPSKAATAAVVVATTSAKPPVLREPSFDSDADAAWFAEVTNQHQPQQQQQQQQPWHIEHETAAAPSAPTRSVDDVLALLFGDTGSTAMVVHT
jgi:hypothetical protein